MARTPRPSRRRERLLRHVRALAPSVSSEGGARPYALASADVVLSPVGGDPAEVPVFVNTVAEALRRHEVLKAGRG
ncbi:hypothetical protein [Streptomyces violaceusniger]|uniref:hypothetical protein n=1 Tax=Streptomyces violaceusniger TaxID=68280 RepID=UPI001237431F|nr:hypothetical protein [Streptomyces violaceusniger]